MYVSATQLFVSTTESASTADVYQGGQFSQQRVQSYARLLTGAELAERVANELDLATDPERLADQVTAVVVPETVLLDVEVEDASPTRAREIAASIGRQFPRLVAEVEASSTGGPSPVQVRVTERPRRPETHSSPRTALNGVVGGLVGLLVGSALAISRAALDRSVRDPAEAADLAGAPIIGTILRDETLDKQHIVSRGGNSRTVEDFRQLRTNLQFLNVDNPPTVIMVSSAIPAEGKTTVVVNLALALVDAGRRVTIIEADLRKPKVTRYLGMVGGVGLTNILAGTADVDDVIQKYGASGLSVIAAGPAPPNPGELLASSQMQALIDKLRTRADYVLVDAPPLLPVADSAGLAVMMDGVLLAVRYSVTSRDQLRQAAATLQRVKAKVLGVILNVVPPKAQVASAYGYGYGYATDVAVDGKSEGPS